jgi:hypothetical protein
MSTQDPYGTPPPHPYAPPPPPKKRTGLIIAAIVAALVVVGGLVVGGVLLLGDDDKSDDTSSESAKDEPTADESEEPTEEPTAEPTEEPTDEPAEGGNRILGLNYTYSLPGEEWSDATAQAIAEGTAVDSIAIWGEQLDDARANVLVETGTVDGETLDEAREGWERNLKSGGKDLQRLPDVAIDGEPGYAVQIQSTNSSGIEIFQSVYLTLHQEIVYSIAFSSQPADDQAEEAFDAIKNSWAWTS